MSQSIKEIESDRDWWEEVGKLIDNDTLIGFTLRYGATFIKWGNIDGYQARIIRKLGGLDK